MDGIIFSIDFFYLFCLPLFILFLGLNSYNRYILSVNQESDLSVIIREKVFCLLVLLNFIGLRGRWLPIEAWPSITFFTSFCLWGAVIIGWIKTDWQTLIAHHTPKDLFVYSGPIIAIIEVLRTLIRPLTLGIRLRANILGGHLVTELLWDISASKIGLVLVGAYESFVCLVQGIIFSLLALSYYEEAKSLI